ncbi:MAG: hypothetical protein JSS58_03120 [Proteobacteria bacterium]|nr:hypothetical protein [Pseudomonadota bacterium]
MSPTPPPIPSSAPTKTAESHIANFQPRKPSAAGKILKWLILTPILVVLVLIVAGAIYLFTPRGMADRLMIRVNKQLPACGSVLVFDEITQQYGKFVSQVSTLLPTSLLFDVRRAKQIDSSSGVASRYCEAEYSSVAGSGTFRYKLEWYDANNPSVENLVVKIDDASAPELARAAAKMLNKTPGEIKDQFDHFIGNK